MQRLARTSYVAEALAHPVDLGALRHRPTARVWVGLFLALLSYMIGWPVIALLGYLAVRLQQPLVLAIGGPVTYGVSHGTFLVGAWLAGRDYLPILMRWAARRAFRKLLGAEPEPVTPPDGGGTGGDPVRRPDDT